MHGSRQMSTNTLLLAEQPPIPLTQQCACCILGGTGGHSNHGHDLEEPGKNEGVLNGGEAAGERGLQRKDNGKRCGVDHKA
jgi:hypothetical protein